MPRSHTGKKQGWGANLGLPDTGSVLLLLWEAAERMQRLRSGGRLCPLFSLSVSLQTARTLGQHHPLPPPPTQDLLWVICRAPSWLPACGSCLPEVPFHVCILAGRGCLPKMMRLKSSRCCHQLHPLWSPGRTPPAHRALSKWGPPLGSQGVRSLGWDGQAKGGELRRAWMFLEHSA